MPTFVSVDIKKTPWKTRRTNKIAPINSFDGIFFSAVFFFFNNTLLSFIIFSSWSNDKETQCVRVYIDNLNVKQKKRKNNNIKNPQKWKWKRTGETESFRRFFFSSSEYEYFVFFCLCDESWNQNLVLNQRNSTAQRTNKCWFKKTQDESIETQSQYHYGMNFTLLRTKLS